MPRKRGFLSNLNPLRWLDRVIVKPLGRVFEPSPPPLRPPAKPPGPGRRPVPPPPPSPYRDVWLDTGAPRSTRAYNAHLEIFLSLPGIVDEPEDEQLRLWRVYIETFVLDERRHAEFWPEYGIDRRDFDWSAWRHARYPKYAT